MGFRRMVEVRSSTHFQSDHRETSKRVFSLTDSVDLPRMGWSWVEAGERGLGD